MANLALNGYTPLKEIQCGTCGVWHAIPQQMFDTAYREGGYWHCPNGHSRGYGESQDEKRVKQLQSELAAEQRRKNEALERANSATLRADIAEREAKRVKKRAHAGVCQCCNRTFTNLARHMATKHPSAT